MSNLVGEYLRNPENRVIFKELMKNEVVDFHGEVARLIEEDFPDSDDDEVEISRSNVFGIQSQDVDDVSYVYEQLWKGNIQEAFDHWKHLDTHVRDGIWSKIEYRTNEKAYNALAALHHLHSNGKIVSLEEA